MTKPHLYKSRHGIYYLRIRKQLSERRISLQTKDFEAANLALQLSRGIISGMTIKLNNISGWTLRTDGQKLEVITEDNDADRASAVQALAEMIKAGYIN